MYCSRCGASLDEGTAFCGSCGTPVVVIVPASAAAAVPAVAAPMPAAVSYAVAPAVFAPGFPYAGFWLRAVAYLIDGLIIGIVAVPIVIGLAIMMGFSSIVSSGSGDKAAALAAAGIIFFIFAIAVIVVCGEWLYFAWMESSTWQATLGKRALGLIVTNQEGKRRSFGHATGRFFSKLVTGLVPLGIGWIMAGFTAKKQALHDFIAGTLVLRRT